MGRDWPLVVVLAALLSGCAHPAGLLAPPPLRSLAPPEPAETAAAAVAPGAAAQPVPPGEEEASALDDPFSSEAGATSGTAPQVADPFAPWNRAMFHFNDKLYFWVLKPAARAYRAVVPRVARTGVENFFHNLGTPVRLASDLLQLRMREAAVEVGSFMINSTWGVLGFKDWFADNPEARTPDADLGLALANGGFGEGFYLVWPFLGPSTLRDSVGRIGDWALDPVSYIQPLPASLGTRAYSQVNATSFRIGDYESLKDASVDPYLATRDAYLQYRAKKARERSADRKP